MASDLRLTPQANPASGNTAGSSGPLPSLTPISGRGPFCHAVPLLVALTYGHTRVATQEWHWRTLPPRQHVDVGAIFRQRPAVMKSVPRFLHGPFRNTLKVAMEEALANSDSVRQERGWKVFLLLPRMLLHRPRWRAHLTRQVDFKIRGFPTRRVAHFVGGQRPVRCLGCPGAVSSQETTSG